MSEYRTENVADYPRPPALERFDGSLKIMLGGKTICTSRNGWRVMETFHPPTYYIPATDFNAGVLQPVQGSSLCEWKGRASYFDLVTDQKIAPKAAWTYHKPVARFAAIADHIAVYAEPMDACFVDGEQVSPQPGNFYGGWVTSWIEGPIKGAAGTLGW